MANGIDTDGTLRLQPLQTLRVAASDVGLLNLLRSVCLSEYLGLVWLLQLHVLETLEPAEVGSASILFTQEMIQCLINTDDTWAFNEF